ncbi:hypothetical protein GCM10010315_57440 [Streptomyces luteosporeus]|uniref:Uncharacterized protein n=1 Tax=Streptomyces luteosporeus TaxID=173856 RepID=A0ABP6GMN0_9ACTN
MRLNASRILARGKKNASPCSWGTTADPVPDGEPSAGAPTAPYHSPPWLGTSGGRVRIRPPTITPLTPRKEVVCPYAG